VGFFSLPPKGVWSTYQALGDILDLEIVQWGNTQGDGTVKNSKCQHGLPECKTMQIYACHKYTSTAAAHATFVDCFDNVLIKAFPKGLPEGTVNITFAEASLKQCAQKLGVDYNKLDKCSTSSEGEGYFQKEKALTPTHTGVPFVTINGGAVIYNSQTLNLVQEVCNAYKGSKKPAACTSLNSTITDPDSYTSLLTPA